MYLTDLEAFDADPTLRGKYTRFACNQPACDGKPHDVGHQSLSVNMETGVYTCFRCAAHGVLEDDVFGDDDDEWIAPRETARNRMQSAFSFPDPD